MAVIHTQWPKPPVKEKQETKKPTKKIVKEKPVVKEAPVIEEPSIEDFFNSDKI